MTETTAKQTDAPQPLVLSCIDGSRLAEAVCDYSIWIANAVSAPLKFLHTIEHTASAAVADLTGTIGLGASEDLLRELTQVEQSRSKLLIEQGNRMLKGAKERAITQKVATVEVRQRHGLLSEALVEMEAQIRVLVVGIRGELHEQQDSGIGTQLESIIRSLHKPILVVNTEFKKPRTAMLAYDGSEAAEKALAMVASSPLFDEVTIHLVYVGEQTAQSEQLLQSAQTKMAQRQRDVRVVLLSGAIEDVLPEYQVAEDIDLTIMGAFSHNRLRHFLLGSFTAQMLQRTNRPLLLLR
ncbi:MAG: universal stress protein [Gammaproteobacteria bacterium]|nr:universal stress protein [Gammaproteobacteria bacterium]